MIPHTCKTCGSAFESKVARTYCSVKCRANDPELKRQLLSNLATPKSRSGPERRGEIQPCVKCGTEIYLTATDRKRGKKACSRSCYRAWMAERFDRHIGSVHTVERTQGFDEYLSQDKLQCLFPGCDWRGDDLGLHSNLAHGTTAAALKAAAGFNRSTGLVSAPLAKLYESRGNKGTPHTLNRASARANHPMKSQRMSPEAREHFEKAMALARASKEADAVDAIKDH